MPRLSRCRHPQNYQAPDRLSDLHDTILSHILSFIPIRDAVKTSILSKRWKHTWIQVRTIYLSQMPHDWSHLQYLCFVEKVMLFLNVSYLPCLRIDLTGLNEDWRLRTFMELAACSEICELEFLLEHRANPKPIVLPTRMLFTCKGLVVLKLDGNFAVVPISFHSPCLETIHLIGFDFCSRTDEFMKVLSSGCPTLKELVIKRCRGVTRTLYVESLTLETLEITSTLGKYEKNKICSVALVIKAPNLRSLRLADTVTQCDICELSLLVEAHLDLHIVDKKHALEFARMISGVKYLVRLGRSVLRRNSSMPPIFWNLTYLKIDADHGAYEALQSTPNLKTLIFRKVSYWDYSFESKSELKCLSCLENVVFSYFEGKTVEKTLVAYFLKVAVVLKEMKISTPLTYRWMHDWLWELPRSSCACHFNIVCEALTC